MAKGSAAWMPAGVVPIACDECGKPVTVKAGGLVETFPSLRAWHHDCLGSVRGRKE